MVGVEVKMSTIYKKLGERIKKLREGAGITQERVAEILGVSRPTISQMESGEGKISAEELIKIANLFNLSVQSLLDLEKEPEIVLKKGMRVGTVKPSIRINVPQKNLEKFKEVLLYVLDKVGSKENIGETVIYKLLYFIDFDYYEKYEEQLIGATYIKNTHGPTPLEFRKIVEKMMDKELMKVKSKYFQYPQTKYLPLRKPDLSKLKANEIKAIDDVLHRLSDMNAKEISEYSHNDVPWLTTEDGKTIEYEAVFYRTTPYSVRDYGDEFL
jgi:transcriptional regulator with XRE-family HTH domain